MTIYESSRERVSIYLNYNVLFNVFIFGKFFLYYKYQTSKLLTKERKDTNE